MDLEVHHHHSPFDAWIIDKAFVESDSYRRGTILFCWVIAFVRLRERGKKETRNCVFDVDVVHCGNGGSRENSARTHVRQVHSWTKKRKRGKSRARLVAAAAARLILPAAARPFSKESRGSTPPPPPGRSTSVVGHPYTNPVSAFCLSFGWLYLYIVIF